MVDTQIVFDLLARDRASRTIAGVGRTSDSTAAKLTKLGLKGGAAFAGLTAAAVGAAALFTYKVGSTYVASLNQIQALTGLSDATMKRAATQLEFNAGLYAKMGQTTGDAAGGVVELTKSGESLNQALKAVNGTMTLAKAGQLSVADASSITANALNTFHLKAKKAGDVANYLANAANISSADVADIAESFKYVAPVAAATGVKIQQVNAVLAELANAGIKGSNAGTGFRKFLLSLQAPSGAAAGDLKDLGVQIYNANGKMKPLSQVIGVLGGALGKLSQQARNKDMKDIFGLQGIASATTIFDGGRKGLETYTKGVEKAGAAQKLAQAQSKGLAGTFSYIKASVISAAQSFYREFSPAIDKAIRPFAEWLGRISTQAAPALRQALIQLQPTFQQIGTFVSTQVVPALQQFATWVQTKGAPAAEELAQKVGKNLRPVLTQLIASAKQIWPEFMQFAKAVGKAAPPIIELASKIAGKLLPIGIKLATFFQGNMYHTLGLVISILGKAAGAVLAFGNKLSAGAHNAAQFASTVKNKISDAVGYVKGIPGRITGAIGNLASLLVQAGKDVINGLWNGIKDQAKGLLSYVGGLASKVSSAFKNPLGIFSPSRVFIAHGVNIMKGLGIGLAKGEPLVKSALDRLTNYIATQGDKLKSLLSAKASFAQGFQSFTTSVFSTDLSTSSTDAAGNDVTTPATVQDMIAYQRQQRGKAQQLKADVQRLHRMGLSNALIKQLQASGESGAAQIHTLAGGTRSQIHQLNALNKQTQGALAGAGNTAAGQLYNDQIAQTRNNEDLAERIAKKLAHALHEAGKDEELRIVDLNGDWVIKAIRKKRRHVGSGAGI